MQIFRKKCKYGHRISKYFTMFSCYQNDIYRETQNKIAFSISDTVNEIFNDIRDNFDSLAQSITVQYAQLDNIKQSFDTFLANDYDYVISKTLRISIRSVISLPSL